MIEAIIELAREQARQQAEKRMREKFGIPENNLESALEAVVYQMGRSKDMFAQIRKLAMQIPREPRIKVSPYAKFDKYHKKKRR